MSHCCQAFDLTERRMLAELQIYCGPGVCARKRLYEQRADTAMRCAWLREHAEELRPFDPTGQLAAQLCDFADLLEVVQERGWLA